MSFRAPIFDPRNRDSILAGMRDRLAGYVPELAPRGVAAAWLDLVARQADILRDGVNGLPEHARLSFLELFGNSQLPAQSARVPLTFKLLDTAPQDVTLPARTQVAAKLPPPPPSVLTKANGEAPPAPVYFTDTTVSLTRGRLAALYSVDPAADTFCDHTQQAETGFTLFEPAVPMPHRLYVGHDVFLKIAETSEITLTFDFIGAPITTRPLLLDWYYLSQNGWLPLTVTADTTRRFTQNGMVRLIKNFGPDAKEETYGGRKSYWIRAEVSTRRPRARIASVDGAKTITLEAIGDFLPGDVVTVDGSSRAQIVSFAGAQAALSVALGGLAAGEELTLADSLPPLRPEGTDAAGVLPQADLIHLRVGFSKTALKPDKLLGDRGELDGENAFQPFGPQPAAFSTLHIAGDDVFSRSTARVQLDLQIAAGAAKSGSLQLSYEYYQGDYWVPFDARDEFFDTTELLTRSGSVGFVCPQGWKKAKVNGEEKFWLRVRILAGDYGHPMKLSVEPDGDTYKVTGVDSTLKPPTILTLKLSYTYFTQPELPHHVLAENDLSFADYSDDARWPNRVFVPFTPIGDRLPALHFGFSHKLPSGLVSLFGAAAGLQGEAPEPSPFRWEYFGERGWTELAVLDETDGFQVSGTVQFVGPADAVARPGLNGDLYWLRARLKTQGALPKRRLDGLWTNTLWGLQGESVQDETLGISSGDVDQVFQFPMLRVPVLPGQRIEVREWSGRGDDWRESLAGVDPALLRFDIDRATNEVVGVWVRWDERPHPWASGPLDRHYLIERSRGTVRFGDGTNGRIPQAGGRIRATYTVGGSVAGNVAAGTITELRSGVGYVQAVSNPLPARGGTSIELLEVAGRRAPQRFRHRDRAVSVEDYEWLAREATPEVARCRALATTGDSGRVLRGTVTLVIVPWSLDPTPQPDADLVSRVRRHIEQRLPAGIADGLRIVGSRYVLVSIKAEITPREPDDAAAVEARIRGLLDAWLHPLTGGPEGLGWDYGATIHLSTIARMIEAAEGVDYAAWIRIEADGAIVGDVVALPADALVASGGHQLTLKIREAGNAV